MSDSLIALAYYSIPITLVYFVRKRQDLPFNWMFLLFGTFIIACGTTHIMEIWTLWHPTYWLSGFVKSATAIVSLYTALELVPLVPKALALPNPAQLEASNRELLHQITERQRAEEQIRKLNTELEQRVIERTAQLEVANKSKDELLVRLEAIINSMTDGLVVSDPAGNLLTMNQAALRIHEYQSDEEVRRHLEDFPDTFDLQYLDGRTMTVQEWPMARALRGETFSNYEVRVRRLDTGTVWIGNYGGTPVRDKAGNLFLAMITVRDVTIQKQAELALQQSEERLRLIVQNMPVMMNAVDANGKFLVWNRECERVTGYSTAEIVGNPRAMELLYPDADYREQMITAWSKRGNDYRDWEWQTTCKDGSVKTTSWFSICDRFPIPGWAAWGIGVDISDRVSAEQQIKELNQDLERRVIERTAQLEAANKELEAFSYSVSHDLRAPLRSIDGFSLALLERYAEHLDDKGKHYLQRVRAASQRMGQLIDDLLNLSRVTRSEMQRQTVDLTAMVQEIAQELQQTQPQRSVEFIIAPGVVAQGDPRLLGVVLENLLSNAWKFTSKNQVHPRIEFGTTSQQDVKHIYFVRDNGAGFDMAYADKLFGAFQRLHTTDEFPGTGIGLATVQRIIHRHGGRVWAEGAIESGSTFYFTL